MQKDSSQRDNLSAAAGVRASLPASDKVTMNPGVSYVRGLHGAIADAGYQMVQVDLPFSF